MFEKRGTRKLTVSNRIGSVVQSTGVIIVNAIVDAAGELIFQITNHGSYPYQVSLREVNTRLDAGTLNVPAHLTIECDVLGGINPGGMISINTQIRG
ncbi:hypothetical protein H9L39_17845 [Fusarium oxysporum f. sp. albedinis]|nr:hypothetical protein H9L39_19995 [Fusarium oxysporum f. sp. albedinis]KAK2470549.1 hypothetical protein H9L39_17845 [Fusarium oxysporum f. sp. albedinis]